ncbi:MAG: DNA polymerase [Candidatus Methanomethylophilaceae archaeon]
MAPRVSVNSRPRKSPRPRPLRVISLDTETTGLDIRHGARPFLVTTADDSGLNTYWEWDVDPMTRRVKVREDELDEIQEVINTADILVLQNSKFDAAGLYYLFQDHGRKLRWNWSKVHDTLLAGHLIKSNGRHDLTSMVLEYLGIDVQPYEDQIRQATIECRRLAQGRNPRYSWRIANAGLPEMPSAKGTSWKYDMWLPRYVANLEDRAKEDFYWTACSSYANSDSTSTLSLYHKLIESIRSNGLERIYRERLKLLPVIFKMEERGITVSGKRLREVQQGYKEEAEQAGKVCVGIAKRFDTELVLPKSGNNKSLLDFVPVLLRKIRPDQGAALPYTPKGNLSLNKSVIENLVDSLPERSIQRLFFRRLLDKRKRDTAVNYLESYQRFWIPLRQNSSWYRLHPSLNPTGSDTLRFSSSNPNEQNISKQEGFNLRYAFGPSPGREWWVRDAQNIELRLPAYESEEEELIDLYEHPDDPPYYGSTHLLNFHTVYPEIWEKELREVGIEKVGPHCKKKYASTYYQWCKNGGFAIQYGAVESSDGWGTADKAFHQRGSHTKLKARFKKLSKLNQKWTAFAEKHGYVETIPDRTVDPNRGYPLYCTRSEWGKILPTVPLNYHIQSSAMWWMMKAMIRCQDYLDEINRKRPGGFYMVMQIHDELVFDFPKGQGDEPWKTHWPIVKRIGELMEEGGKDYGIPTPVSCEYCDVSWDSGRSVE